MALLWMDSFDHYATADLVDKYGATGSSIGGSSQTIGSGNGRRGSNGLLARFGSGISRSFPAASTVIAGFAVRHKDVAARVFLTLGETGADHISLRLNADGSIAILRNTGSASSFGFNNNGTVVATTAAGLVTATTYNQLQLKVIIHSTTGLAELRLNGTTTPVATFSGNTRNGGTGNATFLNVGVSDGTSTGADYDDWWICDGTGPAPTNDYLGDCRVDPRFPTAAGALTQWTPSAGANWQTVDDAAPNDDTDYNSATTVGLEDTFTVQDAPVPGATLYGAQVNINVKKLDAGVCEIAPVTRVGGTSYLGTSLNPGTVYSYFTDVRATNPATGLAWTEAEFNAAEFGYRKTA